MREKKGPALTKAWCDSNTDSWWPWATNAYPCVTSAVLPVSGHFVLSQCPLCLELFLEAFTMAKHKHDGYKLRFFSSYNLLQCGYRKYISLYFSLNHQTVRCIPTLKCRRTGRNHSLDSANCNFHQFLMWPRWDWMILNSRTDWDLDFNYCRNSINALQSSASFPSHKIFCYTEAYIQDVTTAQTLLSGDITTWI